MKNFKSRLEAGKLPPQVKWPDVIPVFKKREDQAKKDN